MTAPKSTAKKGTRKTNELTSATSPVTEQVEVDQVGEASRAEAGEGERPAKHERDVEVRSLDGEGEQRERHGAVERLERGRSRGCRADAARHTEQDRPDGPEEASAERVGVAEPLRARGRSNPVRDDRDDAEEPEPEASERAGQTGGFVRRNAQARSTTSSGWL